MKVDHLVQTDVVTITPVSSLLAAACGMSAAKVGSLAVLRQLALVGIITERDLVRAMCEGADPCTTPVSNYMTRDPEVAFLDDDSEEVACRMAALGLRHLPVVDDTGRLVGMVSVRDIAGLEAWPRSRGERCTA